MVDIHYQLHKGDNSWQQWKALTTPSSVKNSTPSYPCLNLTKTCPPVRRGEGGWDGLGGPLWSPAPVAIGTCPIYPNSASICYLFVLSYRFRSFLRLPP